MMNKLNELVKGKKTEKQKFQEELGLVNGTINEVLSRLNDLTKIREGLEIELRLGADSSLEKRFKKLSKATDETQAELDSLRDRQSELSRVIGEETAKERQEELDSAGKAYEDRVYKAVKYSLLQKKVASLTYNLPHAGDASEIKKLAGMKHNEPFNGIYPEQASFVKKANESEQAGKARAEKEFELLLAQIEKFLNE